MKRQDATLQTDQAVLACGNLESIHKYCEFNTNINFGDSKNTI